MENNRKDHFISIFHAIALLTTRIKHDGDINIKSDNHRQRSSLVTKFGSDKVRGFDLSEKKWL